MKKSIKYLIAFLTIGWTGSAYAQNAEMADTFRSEGKIYVVVAIILIVLTGLIVYLFLLDRRINKLEQVVARKKQTKAEGKSF
ncbi:MAG: CcmD family protein [Cyclobacteriaceae bacterium]